MLNTSDNGRASFRCRLVVGAALIAVLSWAAPALAHDEFRFVGTVVKWDAAKRKLDMKTRETQADGKVVEVRVVMSVPVDVEVMRAFKQAPLSDLKPGVFIVVDAAGVDKEIDALKIEVVVPQPKPVPVKTAKP